jgi:hypothetical protein
MRVAPVKLCLAVARHPVLHLVISAHTEIHLYELRTPNYELRTMNSELQTLKHFLFEFYIVILTFAF